MNTYRYKANANNSKAVNNMLLNNKIYLASVFKIIICNKVEVVFYVVINVLHVIKIYQVAV